MYFEGPSGCCSSVTCNWSAEWSAVQAVCVCAMYAFVIGQFQWPLWDLVSRFLIYLDPYGTLDRE